LTTLSCAANGISAICCDLMRLTTTRLARTFQLTKARRRREQYMPLAAFCLRHFFIICTCEFESDRHTGLFQKCRTKHHGIEQSETARNENLNLRQRLSFLASIDLSFAGERRYR
jgi:hypothetical protein